jgi:hypothetical protein
VDQKAALIDRRPDKDVVLDIHIHTYLVISKNDLAPEQTNSCLQELVYHCTS